jgi:hypothetical protein
MAIVQDPRQAQAGDLVQNPDGTFDQFDIVVNQDTGEGTLQRVARGLSASAARAQTQEGTEEFAQLTELTGPESIEELIGQVTPEALELIEGGARGAVDITRGATEQAISGLQPFTDLTAFNEQQALLGLGGEQAQQQAIAGIPVSDFQREVQERERRTQLRQAAAGGGLGSGATILGAQQLAGAQQSQNIFNRLAELGGLSDISRAARSAISGIEESGGAREAALLQGIGPQSANILLGGAAPITQARTSEAQLSGLQGIASANQQAQLLGQLTNIAGQSGLFNQSSPGAADPNLFFQGPSPTGQVNLPGQTQQQLVF